AHHQPAGAGRDPGRHRLPPLDVVADVDGGDAPALDGEAGEGLGRDLALLGGERQVDDSVLREGVEDDQHLGGVTGGDPLGEVPGGGGGGGARRDAGAQGAGGGHLHHRLAAVELDDGREVVALDHVGQVDGGPAVAGHRHRCLPGSAADGDDRHVGLEGVV